jgi:hypothetical protein
MEQRSPIASRDLVEQSVTAFPRFQVASKVGAFLWRCRFDVGSFERAVFIQFRLLELAKWLVSSTERSILRIRDKNPTTGVRADALMILTKGRSV